VSYFDKHVFFCTNQRPNNEGCCNNHGAQKMRDYVKDKVKQLGISNVYNRIRINSAGCMDRCDDGPGDRGLSRRHVVHLCRRERSGRDHRRASEERSHRGASEDLAHTKFG
jgi:hypothetical protein